MFFKRKTCEPWWGSFFCCIVYVRFVCFWCVFQESVEFNLVSAVFTLFDNLFKLIGFAGYGIECVQIAVRGRFATCCCWMSLINGEVIVREDWYSWSDIADGLKIARPPYLVGRVKMSLSPLLIGWPRIAGTNSCLITDSSGFRCSLMLGVVCMRSTFWTGRMCMPSMRAGVQIWLVWRVLSVLQSTCLPSFWLCRFI